MFKQNMVTTLLMEKSFSTNDPSSLVTNLEVNASFIESLFSAKYSNSYQGDDITTETGFYFSENEDFLTLKRNNTKRSQQ